MAYKSKSFSEEKVEHYDTQHSEDLSALADNVQYGKAGIVGVLRSPFVLGAAFLASTGGFSWVSCPHQSLDRAFIERSERLM